MEASEVLGSHQERECSSPLGLFEKFRLGVPEHVSDESSDSDVQFVSAWEMEPSSAGSTHPQDVASTSDGMVKTKEESQSIRITGCWNAEDKQIEILDELEEESYEPERAKRGRRGDNDDSDLDSIICLDEDQSNLVASDEPAEKISRNECQNLAKPLGEFLKKHFRKRLRKKKNKTREKTSCRSGSHRLTASMPEEQIRGTVVQKLNQVLLTRVQDAENLHVEEEKLKNLAKNVEMEMFNLYQDTGMQYKQKYRSLIFNLKDPKNKILFHRVAIGEVSPQSLIQMSSAEMAGQKLLEWRDQERRHTLEIIERAEMDFQPNQPRTKLTHKGLMEIETATDQMLTLEDLNDTSLKKSTVPGQIDTTAQHKSHLLDVNCLICMEKINPSDHMDSGPFPNVFENCVEEPTSEIQATGKGDNIDDSTYNLIQAVWKGSINMCSIRNFKVTACQVSGYNTHLCEQLPDVLTSKGLIYQESVWEFMDLIWPACTKDMCLLRLYPRSAKDVVCYKRLFSYLIGKLRYAIIKTQKMEAFLVPLPANQPIPAKLHPLGGPGLEDGHPNLLMALLLPNHPSWTSCPKKVIPKQKEFDIPDDIFTSILEDVEREEGQMAGQGIPLTPSEQPPEMGEVGLPELLNLISVITNNIQEVVSGAQNGNYYTFPGQPGTIPEMSEFYQFYNMVPNTEASSTCNPGTLSTSIPETLSTSNPGMYDPTGLYGPPS